MDKSSIRSSKPKLILKKLIVLIIYSLGVLFVNGQNSTLNISIYQTQDCTLLKDSLSIKSSRLKNQLFSDSIQDSYRSKGYLNLVTQTDSTVSSSYKYARSICLGQQYQTIKLMIAPDRGDLDMKDNSLSRKRTRYTTPALLNKTLENLREEYNSKGQPFAKIATKEWDFSNRDTALVIVTIKTELTRKIDRIIVEGYPNYPKNNIDNLTGTNSIYSARTIENLETKISNLPYVDILQPTQTLFKSDSTILYVYVKRKSANLADGLIGFNTLEDGKLEVNGYLEASLVNNFNLGERVDFLYRNDSGEQTRLNIEAEVPALLLKKIGLNAGLEILRRDSLYQNTSTQIGFNYQLPNNASVLLAYRNITSAGMVEGQIGTEDLKANGIIGSYHISSYNSNKLQPENFTTELRIGIQRRQVESFQDLQYTLGAIISKRWQLSNKFGLFGNAQAELLTTKNLQFNELFQIGGANSIRGFNQNNIDTSGYGLLQTEFRYTLNEQIYLAAINDVGVFEEFLTKDQQFIYSFGAGLAILTRAGILRIQIANGRLLNSETQQPSTIAHINLEIAF